MEAPAASPALSGEHAHAAAAAEGLGYNEAADADVGTTPSAMEAATAAVGTACTFAEAAKGLQSFFKYEEETSARTIAEVEKTGYKALKVTCNVSKHGNLDRDLVARRLDRLADKYKRRTKDVQDAQDLAENFRDCTPSIDESTGNEKVMTFRYTDGKGELKVVLVYIGPGNSSSPCLFVTNARAATLRCSLHFVCASSYVCAC